MKRILLLLSLLLVAVGIHAQTPKKALVAYFSATGTTEAAAKKLAGEVGADLYVITPAVKYTAADHDWRNKQSRSAVEMNDKASRPALKGETKDLKAYDTIYLGFPIWWGVAPRLINTFIEASQLKGKTIIPFATSGGSSVAGAVKELRATYPALNIQDGKLLN